MTEIASKQTTLTHFLFHKQTIDWCVDILKNELQKNSIHDLLVST